MSGKSREGEGVLEDTPEKNYAIPQDRNSEAVEVVLDPMVKSPTSNNRPVAPPRKKKKKPRPLSPVSESHKTNSTDVPNDDGVTYGIPQSESPPLTILGTVKNAAESVNSNLNVNSNLGPQQVVYDAISRAPSIKAPTIQDPKTRKPAIYSTLNREITPDIFGKFQSSTGQVMQGRDSDTYADPQDALKISFNKITVGQDAFSVSKTDRQIVITKSSASSTPNKVTFSINNQSKISREITGFDNIKNKDELVQKITNAFVAEFRKLEQENEKARNPQQQQQDGSQVIAANSNVVDNGYGAAPQDRVYNQKKESDYAIIDDDLTTASTPAKITRVSVRPRSKNTKPQFVAKDAIKYFTESKNDEAKRNILTKNIQQYLNSRLTHHMGEVAPGDGKNIVRTNEVPLAKDLSGDTKLQNDMRGKLITDITNGISGKAKVSDYNYFMTYAKELIVGALESWGLNQQSSKQSIAGGVDKPEENSNQESASKQVGNEGKSQRKNSWLARRFAGMKRVKKAGDGNPSGSDQQVRTKRRSTKLPEMYAVNKDITSPTSQANNSRGTPPQTPAEFLWGGSGAGDGETPQGQSSLPLDLSSSDFEITAAGENAKCQEYLKDPGIAEKIEELKKDGKILRDGEESIYFLATNDHMNNYPSPLYELATIKPNVIHSIPDLPKTPAQEEEIYVLYAQPVPNDITVATILGKIKEDKGDNLFINAEMLHKKLVIDHPEHSQANKKSINAIAKTLVPKAQVILKSAIEDIDNTLKEGREGHFPIFTESCIGKVSRAYRSRMETPKFKDSVVTPAPRGGIERNSWLKTNDSSRPKMDTLEPIYEATSPYRGNNNQNNTNGKLDDFYQVIAERHNADQRNQVGGQPLHQSPKNPETTVAIPKVKEESEFYKTLDKRAAANKRNSRNNDFIERW